MTRPSLAGIEQRTAAATEGPWEAFGTTVGAMTGPVDCGGCSGLPSPRHEPACLWRDLAEASEPDTEFIADARTAVPALLAAVRDVLALHREGGEVMGYDAEGVLDYLPACIDCDQAYPCATVRALAAHLDLTDPEGEPT